MVFPANQPSYANVVVSQNNSNTASTSSQHNNIDTLNNNFDSISIESNNHPLFLHNNDHPGMVLIAKKLSGTDNFGPWKRSMQIALSAKNKLVLVNGSYSRPASGSPLQAQYDRVNDMIITWILNTVSDEISDGMHFVNSAEEVWKELHDRFSNIDGHRIYQILKDQHTLVQDERSVEIYYHKLKNLWDEYVALEPTVTCVCGAHKIQEEREQRRKLIQFLMGLHDSFSNARGQILMMNPLPLVTSAFSLIKQDEKQRQGYSSTYLHSDGASLAAVGSGAASSHKSGKSNFHCPTSIAITSQEHFNQYARQSLKCSYCNQENHVRDTCFKLHGYPKKKKARPYVPNQNFRQLPKAMQVQTDSRDENASVQSSNVQLENLQTQVNQMNHMMSLMFANKGLKSPEDHIADARSVRPIVVAREAFEAQFRREMTDESKDKWPVRVSPGGPDPHHH